eukprot:CAMPEP_0198248120 /NCGR_PEP_ID=MMETSP1446-20131203/46816_1 /TAXON_ID=1461542 ORGANISM="Unidentified sp, Strain CCMP2111" /NCGR_SAMPLE_ID=MMETSP1446 /ASSEMBLY_ACC=CAM_ASM_001112 /LENGTH=805 /DNA_ID=CAMNT_0043932449 /DNA_START=54 /DNA_END=2470 /DNA_ORIENTATION=+
MEGQGEGKKRERSNDSKRRGRGSRGRGGKKQRFQRKHFGKNNPDTWKKTSEDQNGQRRLNSDDQLAPNGGEQKKGYELTPMNLENKKFEEYYKKQQILGEEEWDTFVQIMRTQLPATFRINGSGKFAKAIHEKLTSELSSKLAAAVEGSGEGTDRPLGKVMVDGEEIEPPEAARVVPQWLRLAARVLAQRNQIRKLPVLEYFHEFLKRENDAGNITRQEAASMIPPFFLNVKPENRILDMCAAPGSKTFQLLEMIHANHESGEEPAGYVVANDSDAKRCNLLTHQTKRMCSPALLVTNHEGQSFPQLRNQAGEENTALFDRILCDVPCSGDGTMRKAPDIWRRWNHGMGNGLHKLQLRIATRAARLLEVGGRMVYSTCSLNPIENEAVVAEILRRGEGSFELLDVSGELPGLKRRPGMRTWQVRGRNGWMTLDEFNELSEEDMKHSKAWPSFFPDEASDKMPLDRCCRIFPHDDNTGGFFVAVFTKTKEWKSDVAASEPRGKSALPEEPAQKADATENEAVKPEPEGEPKSDDAKEDTTSKPEGQDNSNKPSDPPLRQKRWKGIDPILPVLEDEATKALFDFYGIDSAFPIRRNLITRTPHGCKPKRIYYISSSIKSIIERDRLEKLRISAVGVKIFEKQTNETVRTNYRIAQEGLPAILPFLTKQVFRPTLKEFVALLKNRTLVIPEAPPGLAKPENVATDDQAAGNAAKQDGDSSKSTGYIEKEHMLERPKISEESTLAQLRSVHMGCCIAMMQTEDAERLGFMFNGSPLALSCWRGKITVNLLTSSNETNQILEKFPEEVRK